MKTTRSHSVVAGLLGALALGPAASAAHSQCVKFDGLAAGTSWGSAAGNASGDLVHIENGIRVSVHNFSWPAGGTFGNATVDTGWFTSTPNSVNTNNINLGFDFTGLTALPSQVAIKFRDLGGFENLSINGSPITVGELAGGAGGGLNWTVTDFPAPGGRDGKLVINGTVHSFLLGGQEFWVDTLCVTATAERGLDHFKVYDVEDVEVEAEIRLAGQFDRPPGPATRVRALTFFANPVSKNAEGIIHKNAHLTWYEIEQEREEPERVVAVVNQFGRQKLKLGATVLMAVPSEKLERGSTFPDHLDHFKCYKAWGESIERGVTLRDQFRDDKVKVGEPRVFCVPAVKTHEDKAGKLRNPAAHLVLYEISRDEWEKVIGIRDQFGERKLKVGANAFLAVPSQKLFTEGG